MWEALGFAVVESRVELGGVSVRLGVAGDGISGWGLRGGAAPTTIDGLRTRLVGGGAGGAGGGPRGASSPHPNGATGIDQVVVVTPDFDRTGEALDAAGMPFRRVRDAGGYRQGFRRLGPAILEVVESREPSGEARFWGLVVIVSDLDALAARLGPGLLGEVRAAVQPGRRIATLGASARLAEAVAFMDPDPRRQRPEISGAPG